MAVVVGADAWAGKLRTGLAFAVGYDAIIMALASWVLYDFVVAS